MITRIALPLGLAAAMGLALAPSATLGATAGKKCRRAGATATSPAGGKLVCKRTGRTLRWKVKAGPPAPAPAPTPAPATPAPTAAAGIIPSRSWECGTGYYPYTSYTKLVTSGSSYTVSNTDGTGANTGTYSQGTDTPLEGGTPIRWDTGTWSEFRGEYTPAGTVNPANGKASLTDRVLVGVKTSSYYPTVCTPK